MDSIWKILLAPLLVALIGGIIVGLVLASIQAPEEAAVSAQLQWLDVPNPVYGTDSEAQDRRLKALREGYPNGSFITLLEENRFKPLIRLLRMKFENNSEVRSKEIEVAGSRDALFVSSQAKDASGQAASPLVLKPIAPKETAEVWGISEEWFDFEDNPMRVLHDNRLMDVSFDTMTSDPSGMARFMNEHPFFGMAIVALSGAFVFFLLLGMAIGIASEYSLAFKNKVTTKKEVQKMVTFLDYLRANHPEKLA